MRSSVKIALLVVTYLFIALIGFLIFSFLHTDLPPLPDFHIVSYKLLSGLHLFFLWLPALLFSVSIIGFGWVFGQTDKKNMEAFSFAQFKNYRRLFLFSIFFVLVSFISREIIIPAIQTEKTRESTVLTDFNWYMEHAHSAYEKKNIYSAVFYARQASSINPQSQEAFNLLELFEASISKVTLTEEDTFGFPENLESFKEGEVTTLNLLREAQKAFEQKRYFDAHYYAYWAERVGGENNANFQQIQSLKVRAWNQIESWSGFDGVEGEEIYLKKREGYSALMEGDVLKAYYIFAELYKKYKKDTDIIRYKEFAEDALAKEYFFIEEVSEYKKDEEIHNVEFSLKRLDGGHDSIFIGEVINVKGTGGYVKYLRNFLSISFDKNGMLLYSVRVPYVKLVGIKMSTFGKLYADYFSDTNGDTYLPRLLFMAASKNGSGIVSKGEYIITTDQKVPEERSRVLPISLKDFDLVCHAARGPEYMNLGSLFSFVSRAEKYGINQLMYKTFLFRRLLYPLFLLIIFVFLGIVAWYYRLAESEIFRFVWIFILPIFTVLFQIVDFVIRYALLLVYHFLAQFSGYTSFTIAMIIFVVLLFALSLRFLSLHADYEIDEE